MGLIGKQESRAVAGKPREADLNFDQYSVQACLLRLILLVADDMARAARILMQYTSITPGDRWL